MTLSRRSLLSALGGLLPFGLGARAGASPALLATLPPPIRFRSFEEAVRSAFDGPDSPDSPGRWVEVGDSDPIRVGVQGCHNDRPFAGFPAGALKIVRACSEPGPASGGVRLYVTTLEIARVDGPDPQGRTRPLDFSTLPPAPRFVAV